MKIKAWAILTTGLADGYELTKSPARVQAALENGQTVVELVEKQEENQLNSVYQNNTCGLTCSEMREKLGLNKFGVATCK